jgi:transcriptional regulator with XRE-family HTH domain
MKRRNSLTGLSQELSFTIARLRKQSGLLLEEMSSRAGISRAMWHQVKIGENSPTVALLEKIAKSFGLHPADLLTGEMDV